MPEFCFGSWQTQRYLLGRVRFAPQSGHAPVASASSLSATSGLMHRGKRCARVEMIYSITSSAWASSVGGTVRPSAFAVLG